MSNRIYERFVECPGVIEIRWVSDDPDHHRPSEDMFLCQNNGIPEDYGKKDKKSVAVRDSMKRVKKKLGSITDGS